MESFIKEFLLEAMEDLRVPNNPSEISESPAPASGAPMDDANFAPAPPTQQVAGMQMPAIPDMPTASPAGNPTMQKAVMKKDLVLTVTQELKAIIATCEKQFEKEDMTVETGGIYIANLLSSLATSAKKLKDVMGLTEEPAAEESMPAPEESFTEPMDVASQAQTNAMESDFTEPAQPVPTPEMTSPTEVI